jgi:hypothetical protein
MTERLRLERLLKEEYRLSIAITWAELEHEQRARLLWQFEEIRRQIHESRAHFPASPDYLVKAARRGLQSLPGSHINVEIPVPFELLIMPDSYAQFHTDFSKIAINCIICENLDRNLGRLRRVKYRCSKMGRNCLDVLGGDSRLCEDYEPSSFDEEGAARDIFYCQMKRAGEYSEQIGKDMGSIIKGMEE